MAVWPKAQGFTPQLVRRIDEPKRWAACAALSFKVVNGRKWAPANNVRVLLTKIFQPTEEAVW